MTNLPIPVSKVLTQTLMNEYRIYIRGYFDRGKNVFNLGCPHRTKILVSSFQ